MTKATTFNDLVNEAFILPLRSVLIVDDQYPTWEEIFSEKVQSAPSDGSETDVVTKKNWRSSATAQEVTRLIRQFREHKPGLIIDIHDGVSTNHVEEETRSESPEELADHLHQSEQAEILPEKSLHLF